MSDPVRRMRRQLARLWYENRVLQKELEARDAAMERVVGVLDGPSPSAPGDMLDALVALLDVSLAVTAGRSAAVLVRDGPAGYRPAVCRGIPDGSVPPGDRVVSPVNWGGRRLALLEVRDKCLGRTFTAMDRALLTALAERAAQLLAALESHEAEGPGVDATDGDRQGLHS